MTFETRQGDDNERHQPPVEKPARSGHVQRDQHGRFVGSGNPRGRPRKDKELLLPPTSLAAASALMLRETVKLREGGVTKVMRKYEVIAMRLIHDAMVASPIDRQRAVRSLFMMGGFAGAADIDTYLHETREAAAAPAWTDELEEQYQAIIADYGDDEMDEPPA